MENTFHKVQVAQVQERRDFKRRKFSFFNFRTTLWRKKREGLSLKPKIKDQDLWAIMVFINQTLDRKQGVEDTARDLRMSFTSGFKPPMFITCPSLKFFLPFNE